MATLSAARVRAAHGDAWQLLGVAGSVELPGLRLSASGLPHAQWNNGDVDDPAAVDIGAVREWYDDLGLPWGLRVPAGAPWPHGTKLFTKRLMALPRGGFVAAAPPARLHIRAATPADLDDVTHVDATAFEEDPTLQRPWLALLMDHPRVTVAVAELDGRPVASGEVTLSRGRAGAAGYVTGIAVLPEHRRRGIGAAISSWLVQHAWDDGADLVHLHPDTDDAAAIYRRLGFADVAGLDIYVDN